MYSKDQQDQNAAMLDMDIQQEEILAFFRDYWKSIVVVVAILLVATAAVQIYRQWDARVAGEQTALLLPLANAEPTLANAKALDDLAANKITGNRRYLAWLFAAAKYEAIGREDDAKHDLIAIADSSAPDELRSYARILWVNAGGDASTLDKIGKNSAWQTAASEIRALAESDAQKRRDDFAVLAADPYAPTGMQQRAAQFSGQAGKE